MTIPQADTGTALFEQLTERAQQLMHEHNVPGLALGVIHGGHEHVACLGVTSVENPLPVTDSTLFQIGSTTKTVTATVAARLAEAGRLDLDAPVRAYLPDLRLADETTAAHVTVRQLFTHTAGWAGDFPEDTGDGDDALTKYVAQMVELPQITPLGSVWSYNNAAFCLAGRVIEVVTGQPYEQAARELVLDPLGMTESFYFPAEVMTRRFAVGHVQRNGELRVARPWPFPRSYAAAGGLASSVRDQLKYARFHMGSGTAQSGERVLNEDTMRMMHEPVVRGQLDEHMALSWFLPQSNGVRVLEHGGTTNGQLSRFWIAPEAGVAFTVLTNAGSGGLLGQQLTKWARANYLGAVEREHQPVQLSDEELSAYAGRYVKADVDQSLEVTVQDGTLRVLIDMGVGLDGQRNPPPPPTTIAPLGNDRFVVLEGFTKGSHWEFLRGQDGQVAYARPHRVFVRQD